MQCAASSSGRVRLNDPRNDLARAVRELATITASLMNCPKLSSYSNVQTLRSRSLLFVKLGKRLARLRQPLTQWSRRPEFSVLLMEFADALVNLLQSDRVGMPHRAAAVGGKSIPVEIDDVDVDGAQRVSLL